MTIPVRVITGLRAARDVLGRLRVLRTGVLTIVCVEKQSIYRANINAEIYVLQP